MYKKSSTGWLKHLDFMVLDIICLQLAFVMGYFLRHHISHMEAQFTEMRLSYSL